MKVVPRLKILVVDDTVVYRKIVSNALNELPDIEVVGTAHNGKAALFKVLTLKPDLLTLDIEMPEMNGLEVLQHLSIEAPEVGAIMLSTFTQEGGRMTMRALELGAFDFIPKPQSGTLLENQVTVKNALGQMLKAFKRSRKIRGLLHQGSKASLQTSPPVLLKPRPFPAKPTRHRPVNSAIVAIGVSTGGPNALTQMLPRLPPNIGVPIVIVQHMPAVFTHSLARSLDSKCTLTVREAVNGEPLLGNVVYIAPGGRQMKVAVGTDGRRIIRITDDPPENSCKPSADYLFRSIADHYADRATGVIMTGMGSDGTAGLRIMKNRGAVIIAQDASSCVVFGMPREPIELGIVDVVSPLDYIAEEILKTLSPPIRKCCNPPDPLSNV